MQTKKQPKTNRRVNAQLMEKRKKDRQEAYEYAKLVQEIIDQDYAGNGDRLLEAVGDGNYRTKLRQYETGE